MSKLLPSLLTVGIVFIVLSLTPSLTFANKKKKQPTNTHSGKVLKPKNSSNVRVDVRIALIDSGGLAVGTSFYFQVQLIPLRFHQDIYFLQ